MKDGILIKTSMATIDINLTANDEQTLNILRDSLIGWYEGFCTDCLDNGISCETTFSREETHKPEVKQTETAKTRKHVYDMFQHFKAVTTTECKECDECAKAAANAKVKSICNNCFWWNKTCHNKKSCCYGEYKDYNGFCGWFEPANAETNVAAEIFKAQNHDAVNHPNHYCKGGVECLDAKAASDYVINLEDKIKELGDYIDDVEVSQMNDREDLRNVMKEIGLITRYLDTVVGQYTDYRTSMLRGDSN